MSVGLIGARSRSGTVSVVDFLLWGRHQMVRKVIRQVEPVELDVDQMHGQGKLVCVKLSILRGREWRQWGNRETWSTSASLQILARTGFGRRDLTISFFAVLPVILPLCGPRDWGMKNILQEGSLRSWNEPGKWNPTCSSPWSQSNLVHRVPGRFLIEALFSSRTNCENCEKGIVLKCWGGIACISFCHPLLTLACYSFSWHWAVTQPQLSTLCCQPFLCGKWIIYG